MIPYWASEITGQCEDWNCSIVSVTADSGPEEKGRLDGAREEIA